MAAELGAGVRDDEARGAPPRHRQGDDNTRSRAQLHPRVISAQLARRYGEHRASIHAIEAHHYEVQPQTVEAVLLISADAISASRPGGTRREPRALHQAARIARGAGGCEGGRGEGLRAPGRPRDPRDRQPSEVDDDTAVLLSHEIAREIEDQLEYPGQIKVTVIRESAQRMSPRTGSSPPRCGGADRRRLAPREGGDCAEADVDRPEVRRTEVARRRSRDPTALPAAHRRNRDQAERDEDSPSVTTATIRRRGCVDELRQKREKKSAAFD